MSDELELLHRSSVTAISIHSDYPGSQDPFWLSDSADCHARISYYGVSGYPDTRLDGLDRGDIRGGSFPGILEARMLVDSPLTIVTSATYNPVDSSGVLTASITNVSGAAVSGNFRIALTESGCQFNAPNGVNVHNFTMRDMPPTATGQPISLNPGQNTVINTPFSIERTIRNPQWKPDSTQIICFVQKASPKEILQAARIFFPVNQPYLWFGGKTQSERAPGDGDGYWDAGESGNVVVTVANLNPPPAASVTGTLTTTDPNLIVVDGATSYGTIPGYGSATNAGDPFVVQAGAGTPSGYRSSCNLLVSTGSLAATRNMAIPVGIGTPTDATGPFGTYYAYENADLNYTLTPAYSWVEIDPTYGGAGTLVSLGDDQTAMRRLPFTFRYFGTNTDTVSVCSNGFIALTRTTDSDYTPTHIPDPDGPPSMVAGLWADLHPGLTGSGDVYVYDDAASHRYIVEFSRVYHVEGGNPETFEIILLDPVYYPTASGNGQILVQYHTMSLPGGGVAGIENLTETAGIEYSYFGDENPAAVGIANGRVVRYTTDAPVRTDVPGVAASPGAATLLAASPNPFTQGTALRYRLPERQEAALRIYGVDGRLVSTLFQGVAEAGWHDARWDGRDGAGREVASGLYFARLETGNEVRVGKLMVLR